MSGVLRRLALTFVLAGCGTLVVVDVVDGPTVDAGALSDASVADGRQDLSPLDATLVIPDADAQSVDAADAAPPCVPKSGVCIGNCVPTDDGCGNIVLCSATDCATGQFCSAGVCTPVGCNSDPITTTCDGKCGKVTNNCLVDRDCVCPGGQVCTDGTTCCAPDLPSITCHGACGMKPNNCGQMVDCGNTCASPSTCGGGGADNTCGCTPLQNPCPKLQCKGTVSDGCGGFVACTVLCESLSIAGCTCGGFCPSANSSNNNCVCPTPADCP